MGTTTEAMVPQPTDGAQALTRDPGGVMGLALMTEQEFGARLKALKDGQERIRRIQRELMAEGEDFGKIPGTDKPTLLKPGAEKLCAIYGLKATFEKYEQAGDGITAPHLRVSMTCRLHQGSDIGPVVAQGEGAANSWERKHRYRNGKRTCPACGSEGTIRKSKFADRDTGDIGWWCKDENCKTNFRSDDPAIVDQVVGTVENADPYDVENTLVKMALKRAFIDATLRATATSGLFTQDLEDMQDDDRPERKNSRPANHAPIQVPREPGSDDGQTTQERAAYEKHGVEPPAQKQEPPKRSGRVAPIACPKCGGKSYPTKPEWAKPGKTHYCSECAHKFEPAKVQQ